MSVGKATIPSSYNEGDTIEIIIDSAYVSSADTITIEDSSGSLVKFLPEDGSAQFTKENNYSNPITATIEDASDSQYQVVFYQANWDTTDFDAGIYDPQTFDDEFGRLQTNEATVKPPEQTDDGMSGGSGSNGSDGSESDNSERNKMAYVALAALAVVLWRVV